MTASTVDVAGLVLARWGDGSFTLTGWGWIVGFVLISSFGAFIRDVVKSRNNPHP